MSQPFWAFYFLCKVALHLGGALHLHVPHNLALLLAAMPLFPRGGRLPRWLGVVRGGATGAAGAALLWYDSYLPPAREALAFARSNPAALNWEFLAGLAPGFLSERGALVAGGLLAVLGAAGLRRLHLTPAVLAALLLVPLQDLRRPREAVARDVERFYEAEAGRRAAIPPAAGKPFDVIVVHVCSLGWDDLDATGAGLPLLLQDANYLFTRFDSATSYSGPAALRLLRAPCGQVPHPRLYDPFPADCALMPALRASGFATSAAANYPRESMGQLDSLIARAGLDEPLPVADLPVRWLNYDGEKVHEDQAVLRRWWARRESSGAPRAALYYNTVSLHGGIHEDRPGWWKEPSADVYRRSLQALGRDLQLLYEDIEASGRSAAVLIVSEHGRAMRGTPLQAATLRDIPLPAITRVPAALRLVGPVFAGAPRGLESDLPVSYLGLASLLGSLVGDPSLAADVVRLHAAASALPQAAGLAENQNWKVFEKDGRAWLLGKDGRWRELAPGARAVSGPAAPQPALAAAGQIP